MRNKEKKDEVPFRETKVGGFLKGKFPHILDAVADLTGIKALNVVADLISGEKMSDEDKIELQRLIVEQQRIELENVQGARNREVEVVKALGRPDYAQWVVGVIGLIITCAVVYKGLFCVVVYPEIYFHLLGIIEGTVLLTIFNYYFGQAPGHTHKDNSILTVFNKKNKNNQ